MNQIIRTIVLIALLTRVLSNAAEYAETNSMPAEIHSLMESKGNVISQKLVYDSLQNTNSLRNYVVLENQTFELFKTTNDKKGWSLWDNSGIKYLQTNAKSATLSLSQFEYEIYYPFHF